MKNNKFCHSCKHAGSHLVCNLYNKYQVAARVVCKTESWEKREKK